jgi:hypothetical protein
VIHITRKEPRKVSYCGVTVESKLLLGRHSHRVREARDAEQLIFHVSLKYDCPKILVALFSDLPITGHASKHL